MAFNLSEIFYSIQGEGPFIGRPSIFVRFSGCNLRCKWGEHLCDTPYTSWQPETNLVEMPSLLAKIKDCAPCKNIVITGGEPSLQNELGALCAELKKLSYTIDIETNGTKFIPESIDHIVCSPKLSDSTPNGTPQAAPHERERQELAAQISGKNPKLFLKFVVSERTKVDELLSIVESTGTSRDRVYLMPEGLTPEDLIKMSPMVSDLAMRLGFNFSTRLHIILWGNKRGV